MNHTYLLQVRLARHHTVKTKKTKLTKSITIKSGLKETLESCSTVQQYPILQSWSSTARPAAQEDLLPNCVLVPGIVTWHYSIRHILSIYKWPTFQEILEITARSSKCLSKANFPGSLTHSVWMSFMSSSPVLAICIVPPGTCPHNVSHCQWLPEDPSSTVACLHCLYSANEALINWLTWVTW